MSITTSIDSDRLVQSTLTGSSIHMPGRTWRSHNVIVPHITKVTNGYTVELDGDTFIAENVEAVTGIISAQLLKLGAK